MEKLDLKNGDRRAVSQGEKIVNPACMHCKERLTADREIFYLCDCDSRRFADFAKIITEA